MHNYYFAECCLRIPEKNNFLSNSQLSYFRNKLSHCNKVVLNISSDACPAYENLVNVSVGSGIIVGDIEGKKWLFSSDDKRNPCCIETSCDYSSLQGYINITQCDDEHLLKENFMQLLRIATECHLAYNNGVSVHASCINFNEKAVLFAAPAGTGKSTQANIWEKHMGAKIINGDRPFLHLFSEEVRAYGVPWDGKEQIFSQENYPVIAVVEVRRANSNNLRKMSEDQAFRLMMKQCFIPMWDDTLKFSVMKTIRLIAQKIPFYRLFCLPEESATELLNKVLFTNQNSLLKKVQADMKLREGFILKNIVDEWIVMPTGSNMKNFEGAIVLNDVSAFIWKQLEKPISRDDLLQVVLDEYDINEQTAAADLDVLLEKLEGLGILQKN